MFTDENVTYSLPLLPGLKKSPTKQATRCARIKTRKGLKRNRLFSIEPFFAPFVRWIYFNRFSISLRVSSSDSPPSWQTLQIERRMYASRWFSLRSTSAVCLHRSRSVLLSSIGASQRSNDRSLHLEHVQQERGFQHGDCAHIGPHEAPMPVHPQHAPFLRQFSLRFRLIHHPYSYSSFHFSPAQGNSKCALSHFASPSRVPRMALPMNKKIKPYKKWMGGGRNFERTNVERPIFRNLKIANVKSYEVQLLDLKKFSFNYLNTQILVSFQF